MIPPASSDRCAARSGEYVRRRLRLVLLTSSLVALSQACEPHDALVGAQNPVEESGKVSAGSGGTGQSNVAGTSIGGARDGSSTGEAGRPPMGGTTGEGSAGEGSATGGMAGAPGVAWPVVEAEPGGVPWDAWPQVDEAAAEICRVSSPFVAEDSTAAPLVWAETWQFDAATRVLTRHTEGDGTTEPSVHYVRFDSQGRRELEYVSSSPDECQDWLRDELGNTEMYVLSTPVEGAFDPTTTFPDARERAFQTTRYSHVYDVEGRLESTEIYYPGRGGKQTFIRDEDGCQEIRSEVWVDPNADQVAVEELERWTYQGGRLAARTTIAAADSTDVRRVVRFGYDANGTLASTVVDGYAAIPQPYAVVKPRHDGLADYIVRTMEQPDGSRWLEVLDFTRPDPNAEVTRDGVSTPVVQLRWHFSAGCRKLDLPRRSSRDCEFERPLYTMPIGWQDPYLTPIRPQVPVGAY
jgi:hypothetical protein